MRRFFSLLVLLLSSTAISEPILTEDLHWYSIGTMTLSIESAEGNQVVGTLKLPEQTMTLSGTLDNHILGVESIDTTARLWAQLTDDDAKIIYLNGYFVQPQDYDEYNQLSLSEKFMIEDPFQYKGSDHPLADEKVTCEEKKRYPLYALKTGLLPRDFQMYERNCALDLDTQDFLQPLLKIGREILGEPCDGGTLSLHSAYYFREKIQYFGYLAPHSISKANHQIFVHDRFEPNHDYYNNHYKNLHSQSAEIWRPFRAWSRQSPYNKHLYDDYVAELDKTWFAITTWFLQNHNMSLNDSKHAADHVLHLINKYHFGRLSKSGSQQESNNATTHNNKMLPTLENATMNPKTLQAFIDKGIDVNQKNHFGKTALYYAIQFSEYESAKILLDNDALVNTIYRVKEYDPIKDLAVYQSWNGWEPNGRCLHIRHWFRTPLMHAAQHSDVEMLKLLIEHGADPMMRDSTDETAYDYAVRTGNPENAAYLRSIMPASAFPESTTTTTAN